MLITYQVVFAITAFGAALIILNVILKKDKTKFDIFYALMAVSLMMWAAGRYTLIVATDKSTALFWTRFLLYNGSILVHLLFLHTVLIFLALEKKRKLILIFFYLNSIFLLVFNNLDLISGSSFFIKDVVPKLNFSYYEVPSKLYNLHLINYIFIPFYALIEMLRAMKRLQGEKLQQLKYIIFSSFLGFIGGNSVVPLVYNIPLPPFLLILVPFHLLTLSYAVAKHHLFQIRVIATEIITFALWLLLIIKFALSENYQEFIINGVLLIAVIIVGILLIKSVWRVVKQQEKLEAMAERIKKAYEIEKKAHKQIRTAYHKEKMALELERSAHKELKRLDEAKSQFMMATQHHLRTPLTAMSGYMEMIFAGDYGKIPAKLKEPFRRFYISAKRLISIVEEFLDISQFQLGKKVVNLIPGIKIQDILKEVIEELQYGAQAKNIKLKLEKPKKEPAPAMLDPEKLKAALANVIDNGIKYTRKGGVNVSYCSTDSKIKITIKDTGVGMTKEEQKDVFAKTFERGEEAKKLYTTGRGIGLYIASQIIRGHKGKVWVKSEGKGKGSTFYIELPMFQKNNNVTA